MLPMSHPLKPASFRVRSVCLLIFLFLYLHLLFIQGKVSKNHFFRTKSKTVGGWGVKSPKLLMKFRINMFILHFGSVQAFYFQYFLRRLIFLKVLNVSQWMGGSAIQDVVLKNGFFFDTFPYLYYYFSLSKSLAFATGSYTLLLKQKVAKCSQMMTTEQWSIPWMTAVPERFVTP